MVGKFRRRGLSRGFFKYCICFCFVCFCGGIGEVGKGDGVLWRVE